MPVREVGGAVDGVDEEAQRVVAALDGALALRLFGHHGQLRKGARQLGRDLRLDGQVVLGDQVDRALLGALAPPRR